jgi:ABC-type oligopeptide transport system substrate-binding subunit
VRTLRRIVTAAALLTALVTALGLAACGDSTTDDDGGEATLAPVTGDTLPGADESELPGADW